MSCLVGMHITPPGMPLPQEMTTAESGDDAAPDDAAPDEGGDAAPDSEEWLSAPANANGERTAAKSTGPRISAARRIAMILACLARIDDDTKVPKVRNSVGTGKR